MFLLKLNGKTKDKITFGADLMLNSLEPFVKNMIKLDDENQKIEGFSSKYMFQDYSKPNPVSKDNHSKN